ncbi:MAG TPA: glycosyltransferase family 9 protein [Verrucomicrobiota bacterium]|nr:glycosyltransferase family 9 protein [Verrucomicrobiota bacterium]
MIKASSINARPTCKARKVILRNLWSPGDIVMLTAAVRDLHRHNPGAFVTDVRTACPDLWKHNPYVTALRESERGVEVIDCEYPLIDECNTRPTHCLNGFAEFLAQRLGVPCRMTACRGDIHLSAHEKSLPSQIRRRTGFDLPFWIVVAGGKFDYTIKWWDPARYQAVVDHFRGRLLFVQVGERGHHHPELKGVMDLRGQTSLRQLIRLIHHAQGVLCPVTSLMHLAAAVECRPGRPSLRPCVVVAGGREPPHWEAYPGHQFIHTVGMLPCCAQGGCWRARTVARGDGDERDAPDRLCVDVVGHLPHCMDLITADEVIRRIELYLSAGTARPLTALQRRQAKEVLARERRALTGGAQAAPPA